MRLKNLALLVWFCISTLGPVLPLEASGRVGGITVYPPDEAAQFAFYDGGRSYIDFPGARTWELLESGEEWVPMPMDEVIAAIRQIDYPVSNLIMDVVILYVPRVEVAESSTEGSVVFLTPGRGAYPIEHIHYTVVHEIGHAVHNALMPDSRCDLWRTYAGLRGFDLNGGGSSVPHAWRPHEIFAEDFRALFGGDLARFGGSVENHDLAPPAEVSGLSEFLVSLADGRNVSAGVTVLPNPSAGRVLVRAPSAHDPGCLDEVRIYDVRGRLVCDLSGRAPAAELIWDGRDMWGTAVSPGLYVIRGRSGNTVFSVKVVRVLP